MDKYNVYHDIKARTSGEIYVGVVGPVRSGKSTFIKRVMEILVLPQMKEYDLKEARDEIPQSAAGRTIMTTEPKFIPKEAAKITLGDEASVKIKLIDCVGFMAEGAMGHEENGSERMVKTPWSDQEIPFTQAAKIGTEKVIRDHSTIGIVVTADGSFGDLKREDYEEPEQMAVSELKSIGKPFVIVLNTEYPYSAQTVQQVKQMEEQYEATVVPVNCEQLKQEDIVHIFEQVLMEFPLTQMNFYIPKWLEMLPSSHWLKQKVIAVAAEYLAKMKQMKDVTPEKNVIDEEVIDQVHIHSLNLSNGEVDFDVSIKEGYYYRILSDYTGIPIEGEYQMMMLLKDMAGKKKEYEKICNALDEVRQKGYSVIIPQKADITMEEPQLVRHGNKYGIRMKAEAPAINLISAKIQTEIAPIVGNEQQAKDLIDYIEKNASETEDGIWSANIFGKSVEQIVEDGMEAKVSQLSEDCRQKLQDALQKVINDSSGGMICIII